MKQESDSMAQSIAIVGMGCRFPGGIDSPDALWAFLSEAGDAIRDVPPDRWSLEELYDAERGKAGKIYTRRGGFLDNVREFDPSFFGLSPREAQTMDPQQRLLLETTWESLEDGGIPPKQIRGSLTGVFVGLFVHDYETIHGQPSERRLFSPHSATGTSATVASNRISYCFDLQGPSLTVDTACSSSLVAVHLACQSLLSGETDLALAGGANAILRPEMSMLLCQAGMLSPSGLCRSFDSRADGYVRSEGVGMVVLKRLEDAERDGDPIRAVIRATAVNQDGGGQGMTVPSAEAQKRVIREALEKANLPSSRIGFVEAHGTGTPVGDPIECEAIGTIYGLASGRTGRCTVGSVKSNIGHTESTAGVAGLMKLVLMLEHGRLLPNCHFSDPNPDIDFAGLNLEVSCTSSTWETSEPRVGAVNSFGFGGTNAHAIVQEPRRLKKEASITKPTGVYVIPFSARSSEALREATSRMDEFLAESKVPLQDLAHSLAFHREHHQHRFALVVDSISLAREHLSLFEGGSTAQSSAGKVAFIYSGMGQQWPAMGKELFEKEPRFREVIELCDRELRKHTSEWSLVEELLAPDASSRLDRSDIAQPCLFAVQAGLTALWRSVGVKPDMVLGHSAGEAASFHAAGALSLEDALRVSFVRGFLQQKCSGKGSMLAIGLPKEEIEKQIADLSGEVVIAAENSPSSVTLSGDTDTLKRLAERLEEEQIFARFVPADIPYHSPAMDCILEDVSSRLEGLTPRQPETELASSVAGAFFKNEDADAAYWCRNVRKPVMFRKGFETLRRNGATIFVEIAAHPVLSPSMRENLSFAEVEGAVVGTLRRNVDGEIAFRNAVGDLFCHGIEPDWNALNGLGRFRRLPTYPFQNEEYWEESEVSKSIRLGQPIPDTKGLLGPREHPLLGNRLRGPECAWRGVLGLSRLPFLSDHRVGKAIVFPGAAGIEMLLAAAKSTRTGNDPISLENLKIGNPIIIDADMEVSVETRLRGKEVFVDSSSPSGQWSRNFQASITDSVESNYPPLDLPALRNKLPDPMDRESVYKHFADIGLNYGERFRGLRWLQRENDEAFGEIHCVESLPEKPSSDYWVHPATLDACFQVGAILPEEGTYLPVGADRITYFSTPQTPVFAWAKLTFISPKELRADVQVADGEGEIVLSVENLTCQRSDLDGSRHSNIETLLHTSEWIEAPLKEIGPSQSASYFPSPGEVRNQLSDWIAQDSERLRRNLYYKQVSPDLEQLSTEYILSAFIALGFDFALKKRFSTAGACETLGIASQHRQLAGRLFSILAEDGYLGTSGPESWEVIRVPESVNPDDSWAHMLFAHPAYEAEFLLLDRCGERLPDILTGDLDPLEVLFPPNSSIAEQLYRDSPTFAGCKRIAREVVSRLIDSLPQDRILRVLEVGGGTGSLTSYLLPLFPAHRTEYHFTDLSLAFTNNAERRFSSYPFVTYDTFDLESGTDSQGLESGSFDLILASDVVHATRDLRRSAKMLRELLAPQGQLLMTESTHAPRWFDLVFGTLEGWWLFQDFDLRSSHPTIPFPKWKGLLREVGFEEIEGLSDPVEAPLQTLILAKAPCANGSIETQAPPDPVSRSITIFPDRLGFWQKLSSFLPNAEVLEEIPDRIETKDILFLSDFDYRDNPATASEVEEAVNRLTIHHLEIIQALAKMEWKEPPTLWWITSGAELVSDDSTVSLLQATSRGLARVATSELAPMAVCRIDLSADPTMEEIHSLVAEISHPTNEREITLRRSKRFVSRLVRKRPTVSGNIFRIAARESGGSDSLALIESKRISPGLGEVEIEVAAGGLNFKDVARLTGLVEKGKDYGNALGLECAGTIVTCGTDVDGLKPGDRVMGLLTHGAFSSYVTRNARLFVKIPDRLSFEEASTLPVAFLSAWHSLVELAEIQKGETVLIHTASGGLGLAAIQVARLRGARILATAGSPEKRQFLRRLGIEYVGDSRSTAFVDEVKAILSGDHVDVILNTLPEDTLEKNLSLLRPVRGRFIDLANLHSGGQLPLSCLKRGVQFIAFDLETILTHEPDLVMAALQTIASFIQSGELAPLPFRNFSCTDALQALALMRSSQHIGKILLTLAGEGRGVLADSGKLDVKQSEGTCLIAGGLGGFGLATARWIAECGIRRVVLLGRKGVATESVWRAIAEIENLGTEVKVEIGDVADEKRMRELISDIEKCGPPLKGIVHAAMVLEDVSLKEMSPEQMTRVLHPKVTGGWILDRLTRDCDLDFFVSFSSFSSSVGPNDQGNYAAANAYLDSLAFSQRLRGIRGSSVSWGSIGSVGYVSGNSEIADFFRLQGVFPIELKQCWKILRYVIEEEVPHVSAVAIDWDRFGRYNPVLAKSPRYSLLLNEPSACDLPTQSEIEASLPLEPEERREALESHLSKVVGNLLGLRESIMRPDVPLTELGFDSLMAAELALRIRESTTVELPRMTLLASGLDVATLAGIVSDKLESQSGTKGITPKEPEELDLESVVDELDEEDIDELLGEMLDSAN